MIIFNIDNIYLQSIHKICRKNRQMKCKSVEIQLIIAIIKELNL
jgi:hypothetical protein